MAIGKVNAYASVTAPQADFGSIALNAQKFQQAADSERLKMAVTLKEQKQKEFKPQDFGVKLKDSKIGVINKAGFDAFGTYLQGWADAYERGDNVGMANNKAGAEQLANQMGSVGESIIQFDKDLLEGKISPVSQGYVGAMFSIQKGNIQETSLNDNGELEVKLYETESSGQPKLDVNGDKVSLKVPLPDGTIKESFTLTDIINYKAYVIPEVNVFGEEGKKNGIVQSLAGNIGMTETTDQTGLRRVNKVYLEKDEIDSIKDNAIKTLMSDRRMMAAIAYKYLPENDEFKKPKAEYTKQEYELVGEKLAQSVMDYYDVKDKETYLKGSSRSGTGKKEEFVTVNVNSFYKSAQGLPIERMIPLKDGSYKKEATVLNGTVYEASFVSGEKNRELSTFGVLYDKKSKDYKMFIKLNAGQTGSSGYGANASRSGAGDTELGTQTIFLTPENRAKVDNILVSAKVINPETGELVKTYKELYDYIVKKANR